MTFIIEKDVPVPTSSGGRQMKYPFEEMRKGESFLVTDEKEQKSVISCARNYTKKTGVELIARKVENGVRVWRVDGRSVAKKKTANGTIQRRVRRTKEQMEAARAAEAAIINKIEDTPKDDPLVVSAKDSSAKDTKPEAAKPKANKPKASTKKPEQERV